MTKKDRNSARLMITGLGGTPGAPMPVRSSDSATTIRVKLVTVISRPGARLSTVSISTSWMARADIAPSPPRVIVVPCAACACAAIGARIRAAEATSNLRIEHLAHGRAVPARGVARAAGTLGGLDGDG